MTWAMAPRTRKVWLAAHVAVSVGWFGGAYAMLIMAIVAMTSAGAPLRPAAYELMHLSDTALMIPGCLVALITGLVLALYTKWGVLRHWWVVAKLLLTVAAMIYAALYVSQDVKTALHATLTDPRADVENLAAQIIAGSAAMLAVLLAVTMLSIFKPWGRTQWSRRAGTATRADRAAERPGRLRQEPNASSPTV
jgi:hypothetical protein